MFVLLLKNCKTTIYLFSKRLTKAILCSKKKEKKKICFEVYALPLKLARLTKPTYRWLSQKNETRKKDSGEFNNFPIPHKTNIKVEHSVDICLQQT